MCEFGCVCIQCWDGTWQYASNRQGPSELCICLFDLELYFFGGAFLVASLGSAPTLYMIDIVQST